MIIDSEFCCTFSTCSVLHITFHVLVITVRKCTDSMNNVKLNVNYTACYVVDIVHIVDTISTHFQQRYSFMTICTTHHEYIDIHILTFVDMQ